ncbi:MAG: hypothetical protein Q8M44_02220 [bacterium]|nr:hypothetical protein [bacterium]
MKNIFSISSFLDILLVNHFKSVLTVFKSISFIQTKSIVFFNNFNEFSKAGFSQTKILDRLFISFTYQNFLKLLTNFHNSRVFSKLNLVFFVNDSSSFILFHIIF